MADLEKTIQIIFEGKNNLDKTISSVERSFSGIGDGITGISSPVSNLTENVLLLDGALATLAAVGLGLALKKSIEFEDAVVELRKVVGDSPDEINAAKDAAFELSDTYGKSASKVLASTADFIQAGFNTEEAMGLTKSAMDLVIAGSVDAGQASEYLISILKGFKAPAEDATRVVDILNEVSNRYATDVEQLAIGMADLSPIAKTMGFSMEETAGILTPVIEIFRSGSESAKALKTGLLKLIDDSEPVRKALASIGVSQQDANGQLRSGKEILLDVANAFRNLDEPQKLFITQQLVGVDQSARMVEVFNGLTKTMEITEVAYGAMGSAQKEVDARLASSAVAVDRFKVGLENFGIFVGDQFKAAATSALVSGTDILSVLRQMAADGTFTPIFEALTRFGAKIGSTLEAIATNLHAAMKGIDFTGLIASLAGVGDAVGDAFASMFGEIDLTTIEGLHRFIQKLIDGLAALANITKGIISGFTPLWEAIGFGIDQFSGLNQSTAETIGKFMAFLTMIDKVIEYSGVLSSALWILSMKAFLDVGKAVFTATGYVSNLIATYATLGAATVTITTAGLAAAGGLGYLAGTIIRELVPGVKDATDAFLEFAFGVNGERLGIGRTEDEMLALDIAFEKARAKHKELVRQIENEPQKDKLSESARTYVEMAEVLDGIQKVVDKVNEDIQHSAITLEITPVYDEKTGERIGNKIKEQMPDGTINYRDVIVDSNALKSAKNKIDEAIPENRKIEIDLQKEKIKADAETIQKAMEFKAKIDIAEVEAETKRIESMFASINESIKSTGDVISTLTSDLVKAQGLDKGIIEGILKAEEKRREEAFEQQKDLVTLQTELLREKIDQMRSGDNVITVQADGLKPHLEAILWEVLEAIQLRASEEQTEFLLGIQ